MREGIESLFDEFYSSEALAPLRRWRWPGVAQSGSELAASTRLSQIDVIDKEDGDKLVANLPGLEEKDIDIQVTDRTLTLSDE